MRLWSILNCLSHVGFRRGSSQYQMADDAYLHSRTPVVCNDLRPIERVLSKAESNRELLMRSALQEMSLRAPADCLEGLFELVCQHLSLPVPRDEAARKRY